MQIESDSKLQFYPTAKYETLRAMNVLGGLNEIGGSSRSKEYMNITDYEAIRKVWYDGRNLKFPNLLLEFLLDKRDFNLIETVLESNLSNIVVADLFAGEGEWLKDFKRLSSDPGKKNVTLIGNELEEGRYDKLSSDGLVDYVYNGTFEELQIPKKLINIMLFNPPYGITNGERNVRRYFRMILERDLLTNDAYVIVAAKAEDILNCSDLIVRYFDTSKAISYKTHPEEFEKFKQQMLFLKVRNKPLDLEKTNELIEYKAHKETFENYIVGEFEFDTAYYECFNWLEFKKIDIKKSFDNFEYIRKGENKLSNRKSKAMRWVIDETRITDLAEEVMNIPKSLKSGELANVIASGKINGSISLNDGIGSHIACGGVKDLIEQRNLSIQNKKGEMEDKKETILKSEPYLNILISNKGKLEIKELKSGGIKDDTVSKE